MKTCNFFLWRCFLTNFVILTKRATKVARREKHVGKKREYKRQNYSFTPKISDPYLSERKRFGGFYDKKQAVDREPISDQRGGYDGKQQEIEPFFQAFFHKQISTGFLKIFHIFSITNYFCLRNPEKPIFPKLLFYSSGSVKENL